MLNKLRKHYYVEKATKYNLKSYQTHVKKYLTLSIVSICIGGIGFFASAILGGLVDLAILFALPFCFLFLIIGVIGATYNYFCLLGIKECKKIIKQINKEIVFIKDLNYDNFQDSNYLLSIVRNLTKSENLNQYKLFNNIFLYPSNVELDEKLIYKNNRLLKFHIENNKIVIEHCPNCNHELYYDEDKCQYC